ncbi:hypothetical protein K1719_034748 [Acacia pycnantha]|nr:hypothetical protein K1719_034748 [Acacia pycnantha]
MICFSCGRFGHRRESCPYKEPTSEVLADAGPSCLPPHQPPNRPSINTPATSSDEAFGPWMLVNQKPSRFQTLQRSESRGDQRQASGPTGRMTKVPTVGQRSRFVVIQDLEGDDQLTPEDARQAEIECWTQGW